MRLSLEVSRPTLIALPSTSGILCSHSSPRAFIWDGRRNGSRLWNRKFAGPYFIRPQQDLVCGRPHEPDLLLFTRITRFHQVAFSYAAGLCHLEIC